MRRGTTDGYSAWEPLAFGEVALIPLTRGMWAAVDAGDVSLLQGRRWNADAHGQTFYAVSRDPATGKREYMHRVVLGLERGDGLEADHINRFGLDNRRSNLRVASSGQNGANSGPRRRGTSGYKGVTWHRGAGKWVAQTSENGRLIHLGLHDTAADAARAYDRAARERWGDFAYLNFP